MTIGKTETASIEEIVARNVAREKQLEALVEAMNKAQAEQDKAQAELHAENVRLRKELEDAKR